MTKKKGRSTLARKRSKGDKPTVRGPGIFKLALLALAFCLIVIAAVGGLGINRIESEPVAGENAALARTSGRLAGEINARIRQIEALVSTPGTATAFRDGGLSEVEQQLTARIPEALGVRLIAPGMAQLDEQGQPSIGYAILELIRRADAGAVPRMEVHRPGTEQAQLVVVRPVRENGEILGTALIGLDPKLLDEWLRIAATDGGYYELRQAGSPALTSAGTRSGSAGAPVREMVAGTALDLTLVPSASAGPAKSTQGTLLLLALGGVALAVAVAFLLLAAVLRRLLKEDLARLVQFVERRTRGEATIVNMRLVELQSLAFALQAAAAEQRPPVVAASSMADAPRANFLSDEEPPAEAGLLLFTGKSGVEVEEVGQEEEKPSDPIRAEELPEASPDEVEAELTKPAEAFPNVAEILSDAESDTAVEPLDSVGGSDEEALLDFNADAFSAAGTDEESAEATAGNEAGGLEPAPESAESNLLDFEFDLESFRAEHAEEPESVEPDVSESGGNLISFEIDPALLEGVEEKPDSAPSEAGKKEENS